MSNRVEPETPKFLDALDGAFASLFANAPYGMMIVNSSGQIMAVNDRLSDMFEYEHDELVDSFMEQLLPERFRTGHVAQREGYHASPSPRAMGQGRDLTGLRKSGVEFPLEIGLCSIATHLGTVSCATVVDITDRKRAELRLREANAQLEEFTYVASHDLRSPIRGIANLIEFVREDYAEGQMDGMIRNLDRMSTRVDATEALIGDLLTYARAGRRSVTLEPIPVADTIQQVIDLEEIPDTVTVEIKVDEQACFNGARTPFMTVLRNLIANAVKHHDLERGHIELRSRFNGNSCIIDVIDDGPGIPVSAHERVFRLFQTLNVSERQSQGLGLAVSQRLAEGHGATITLDGSDEGRGCHFTVTWPRYARSDLDD